MKKQEIIDVLGKPYKEIYLSPSSETLWYVIHLIPFKFNMAITLENGVVVEMGQITDERIEKYLEAEDDPIFSMLNQFFKAFLLI